MNLKKGFYIRTKKGIGKIDEIRDFMGVLEFHLDSNTEKIYQPHGNMYWNNVEDIIGEPSEQLIDLIEVGDYVNGYKVKVASPYMLVLDNMNIIKIEPSEIKNVVTKEQFEACKYVVEGDNCEK